MQYSVHGLKLCNYGTTVQSLEKPFFHFGETPSFTIKFDAGVLSAGDVVVIAIDNDRDTGDDSPIMAGVTHAITQEEVSEGEIEVQIQTRYQKFHDVTNGKTRPVASYFGIYKYIPETREYVTLCDDICRCDCPVANYGDPVVILPEEIYYNRSQINAIVASVNEKADDAKAASESAAESAASAAISAAAAETAAMTIPVPSVADYKKVISVDEDGEYVLSEKSGASSYSDLDGKPSIGGITIDGDHNPDYYGIAPMSIVPPTATSTNRLVTAQQMGEAIEAVEARQVYATSAQGSFATHAALIGADTFYLANGSETTPTKNDVAYVLADETHSGKSAKYTATFVDDVLTWGFVITFSDNTFSQAQMDAINSKATEEKIAKIETAVQGVTINGETVTNRDGLARIPAVARGRSGVVRFASSASVIGLSTDSNGNVTTAVANNNQIDARGGSYAHDHITASNLNYAVRSVLPLITDIPASTSAYTLLAQDATTNNHSNVYAHSPASAPTYTLPAVTNTTTLHEIVLYLDLASTASVSFQDSEGNPVAVDTNGVTPTVGELWTLWAEYNSLAGEWLVRGMRDKEAQA